jgi:hypothetical protein
MPPSPPTVCLHMPIKKSATSPPGDMYFLFELANSRDAIGRLIGGAGGAGGGAELRQGSIISMLLSKLNLIGCWYAFYDS